MVAADLASERGAGRGCADTVLRRGVGRAKPSGVIEEILGDSEDPAVQILAVAHAHGLGLCIRR